MSKPLRPADHPAVIIRFLSFIEVCKETGCHIWCGTRSFGGGQNGNAPYGSFAPGGEVDNTVRAHVFAGWLYGLIPTLKVPEGMNLDHTCVNSLCVRRGHLELVTKQVNQDRKKKR